MALFRCPECNRQVSDLAAACPNCGCDFRALAHSRPMHPTDRRMWLLVGLAAVAFVVYVLMSSPRTRPYDELRDAQQRHELRRVYERR